VWTPVNRLSIIALCFADVVRTTWDRRWAVGFRRFSNYEHGGRLKRWTGGKTRNWGSAIFFGSNRNFLRIRKFCRIFQRSALFFAASVRKHFTFLCEYPTKFPKSAISLKDPQIILSDPQLFSQRSVKYFSDSGEYFQGFEETFRGYPRKFSVFFCFFLPLGLPHSGKKIGFKCQYLKKVRIYLLIFISTLICVND